MCILVLWTDSLQTIYIGVQGQGTMNSYSLVVMDDILQQSAVTASVVEGDTYSRDLSSLLITALRGQRYVGCICSILLELKERVAVLLMSPGKFLH